jgi:hypothetical protein
MNDDAERNAVFCALITQRPNSRPEHLMAEAHEISAKGRRTLERIARIAAATRRYEEWAAGKPNPMSFPEALPQVVTGLKEFRPAVAKKNLKTLLQYISPFYRRQDLKPENPDTLIEHWQKNEMPLFDVYFLANCYHQYWPEIISEKYRANARKRSRRGPDHRSLSSDSKRAVASLALEKQESELGEGEGDSAR